MQQKEYTCPMHPQVRQDHPGSCPYCGMALELTVGSEEAPELANFRRRFWISLILTLPILFSPPLYQALLATPVVLWGGFLLFVKGLWTRQINMFTLISIGVGTAYFFSLWAFFNGHALYFEVAAVI